MEKSIQKWEVSVEGMSCQMCANTIQRVLQNLEGVEDSKVDLQKKAIWVSYQDEIIEPKDMKAAVEELGYHVVN